MDIDRIVDIAAPPEQVWTVVTDIERWSEWTTSVTSVELLSGALLNRGSQARIQQPRLPVGVWTTAFELGRYFEVQNIRCGLKTVAGHRVESRGSDRTRVTLSAGWTGPLAPLIRLLYGKLSRRYVETEAQGLKRRCEAS